LRNETQKRAIKGQPLTFENSGRILLATAFEDLEGSVLYFFSSPFGLVYDFDFQYAPVWADLDGNGVVDGKDLVGMVDSFNNMPCPWCE